MKKQLWNAQWDFKNLYNALMYGTVDLPHDAMILERRDPNLPEGHAVGYFPGGKYEYTKTLTVDKAAAEQQTFLELEGVYQKSEVYCNGELVGSRIYGYSNNLVDLTGTLKAGDNEIKVIADNTQYPNSRWYPGSGIYRDVWLWTSGKEYIEPFGVKAVTKTLTPATLSVEVHAVCEAGATATIDVCKDGKVVSSKTLDVTGDCVTAEVEVPDAKLWSAETPELYDLVVTLSRDGKVLDTAEDRTGIRTLSWNAKEGFLINGTSVKLRGACVHHDHGPLGAKSFKAAELRRAKTLKESGFNAIRYSHNPAGRAFLEACDEVGMYVMDETFDTWYGPKSKYDYNLYFDEEHVADMTDMIKVAYNHPSVVIYSIGNEINLNDLPETADIAKELVDLCHKLDPTRPAVNAVNPFLAVAGGKRQDPSLKNDVIDPTVKGSGATTLFERMRGSFLVNLLLTHALFLGKYIGTEKAMEKVDATFQPLDMLGFNYGEYLYEAQHEDHPERVLFGSETYPQKIYEFWELTKKHPYVIGDFTWTGWDYLGEAGVGAPAYNEMGAFTRPYPCIAAGCSNIDLTGYIKAQGHYFKVVYGLTDAPFLAVHPVNHSGDKLQQGSWVMTDAEHSWSWNGLDGTKAVVDVYANTASVELFLNGQSLGKKKPERCIATYEIEYRAGELKAVSYDMSGRKLGEDVLKTASDETVVRLKPEQKTMKADRQELLYVGIELEDNAGIKKALEDQQIEVSVEGAAELIGLCSGDCFPTDPFVGNTCKTFYGRAVAVLRPTGETGTATVTVHTQKGLSDTVRVDVKPA